MGLLYLIPKSGTATLLVATTLIAYLAGCDQGSVASRSTSLSHLRSSFRQDIWRDCPVALSSIREIASKEEVSDTSESWFKLTIDDSSSVNPVDSAEKAVLPSAVEAKLVRINRRVIKDLTKAPHITAHPNFWVVQKLCKGLDTLSVTELNKAFDGKPSGGVDIFYCASSHELLIHRWQN